jgi:hypothetical protein
MSFYKWINGTIVPDDTLQTQLGLLGLPDDWDDLNDLAKDLPFHNFQSSGDSCEPISWSAYWMDTEDHACIVRAVCGEWNFIVYCEHLGEFFSFLKWVIPIKKGLDWIERDSFAQKRAIGLTDSLSIGSLDVSTLKLLKQAGYSRSEIEAMVDDEKIREGKSQEDSGELT